MSTTVFVCGMSGSGKTTAARTLDPKETVVFRAINRTLPFRGAKDYVKNRNIFDTPTFDVLQKGVAWADRQPWVRNVVVTDGTYLMRNEFIGKIAQVGFQKFNDLGAHTKKLFDTLNSMRDDIVAFLEWHAEPVTSDGGVSTYAASTVGNLVDRVSAPFENVDVILWAEPQYDDRKKITYGFWTNRAIGRGGAELPAKSPDGMFDETFIPNDDQAVAETIRRYYGYGENAGAAGQEDAAPAVGGGEA